MVSANTREGSRPETKVSVQTTLATKPVATFGTSRARAAVSATALKAVVAVRMRIRFRRFTGGLRHDAKVRAGHDDVGIPRGSPDLENGLVETLKRLADFKILQELQRYEDQAADALRRRYSVGVTPVVALKARLNGPSDWKPVSIAIVITGTSAWLGSASAALASAIRCSLRNTLKLR